MVNKYFIFFLDSHVSFIMVIGLIDVSSQNVLEFDFKYILNSTNFILSFAFGKYRFES